MEALMGHPTSDISLEAKWGKMFAVSLVLHLAVFSMVLFVPEPSTHRQIRGTVYEVNLVELPKGKQPRIHKTKPSRAVLKTKPKTVKRLAPSKTTAVDRIQRLESETKPLVIAKKTTKTKTKKLAPSPAPDTTQAHIDQALERIKKNVQETKTTATGPDLSRMEAPTVGPDGGEQVGRVEDGIRIQIYQNDVRALIMGNWSFPAYDDKSLAATVVLTVQKNGAIVKTHMSQSSGNERFDQSVLKAIKRSDPLPPFPAGYRKTHEEIIVTFDLSDLENL